MVLQYSAYSTRPASIASRRVATHSSQANAAATVLYGNTRRLRTWQSTDHRPSPWAEALAVLVASLVFKGLQDSELVSSFTSNLCNLYPSPSHASRRRRGKPSRGRQDRPTRKEGRSGLPWTRRVQQGAKRPRAAQSVGMRVTKNRVTSRLASTPRRERTHQTQTLNAPHQQLKTTQHNITFWTATQHTRKRQTRVISSLTNPQPLLLRTAAVVVGRATRGGGVLGVAVACCQRSWHSPVPEL